MPMARFAPVTTGLRSVAAGRTADPLIRWSTGALLVAMGSSQKRSRCHG